MKKLHSNISTSNGSAKLRCRDEIDLIRTRLGLLAGRDKVLMTMYVQNGNTFRQMAQLAGVSETAISRRINKVIDRLIRGKYIKCLRNRHLFSGAELRFARDYFLLGMSIRQLSEKSNISYYSVRKTIREICRRIDAL